MEKKNYSLDKKALFVLVLGCVCIGTTFAQDASFGLNSKVGQLVTLLNQPWIKGVAFIALVVEAIGMITAGRQEPGMFKKFIPWIAGTIIFIAAPTITAKFMDSDGEGANQTLGLGTSWIDLGQNDSEMAYESSSVCFIGA